MFNFLFGLLWTAIVTPIFITYLVNSGEQSRDLFVLAFLVVFEVIGLFLTIIGLRKIIKDSKTKKYGIKCYGVVKGIKITGSYVNENPEYKAILDFVNPETNQLETIEEIIGFDCDKYPIDSCVLCKYYQGDINIENLIAR